MRKAVAIALISAVAAWHDPGHALTSTIAKKVLNAEDPKIVPLLDRYLQLTSTNWDHVHEDLSTLERVATWADQIKTENFATFSNMHFLDVFFENDASVDSGYTLNLPQCGFDDYDSSASVEDQIADYISRGWWGLPQLYQTTIQTFEQYKDTVRTPYSIDFAIRIIAHLIGDSHQPLHTTGFIPRDPCYEDDPRCTHSNGCLSEGDQGGNYFLLENPKTGEPNVGGQKNLHAFWDSMGLWFSGYNDEFTNETLNSRADELMEKFPRDRFEKQNINLAYDITTVFQESFELAVDVVYKPLLDILNNKEMTCEERKKVLRLNDPEEENVRYVWSGLTTEYNNYAVTHSQRQVVLAGLRMATEFKKLYDSLSDADIAALERVEASQPIKKSSQKSGNAD